MNPGAIRHTVLACDLVWIVLSALAAFMLRNGPSWDFDHLQVALRESAFLISLATAAWVLVFHRLRLDGFYGGYELPAMISQLFTGTVVLVLLLAAAVFLLHRNSSRLLLIFFALLFFVLGLAGRIGARALARRFAARGKRHRVLILGKGRVAQELAARIQRHPEIRWEVVGFLFPSAEDFVESLPGTGTCFQLNSLRIEALLEEQGVNEIVVTFPVPDQSEMLNLLANCRQRGIRVSFVPNLYQLYMNRPSLLDLDGLPLLRMGEGKPSAGQAASKRIADLVLGVALLVFASPLLLACATLLWVRKGACIISEMRCGRNGRIFRMYRFNCERGASAPALDQFLHTSSISELPQLWNVLKGDMSLVGPEPEAQERVKRYSDWQRQRLACKPGMAGLAQVHGLREESSSDEKAYYDLRYIQDWSLLTDLALLLQTIWTVIHRCFRNKSTTAKTERSAQAQDSGSLVEMLHVDRP
jgi:lipopolysaccharide/colanic/teichoic acid biosynthesis glycosyltransferase